MGAITRSLSNNITTGGVILPAGITNSSVSAVTSFANASGGTLILLSTQTASSSATISFSTGIDSTYDEYIFKFINIHPSAQSNFTFQGSTNGGSSYGVTTTDTFFAAYNPESGTSYGLAYDTVRDLAQSTSFIPISQTTGINNDDNTTGVLSLFNPSTTTYVKHFIARTTATDGSYEVDSYVAGYFNTTTAINAIQFKMSSGNIDDGIIKLYGVKKS
jgi:hypothetical protein